VQENAVPQRAQVILRGEDNGFVMMAVAKSCRSSAEIHLLRLHYSKDIAGCEPADGFCFQAVT
jgi:hypothetical protein